MTADDTATQPSSSGHPPPGASGPLFTECEEALDAAPLRQGDIFEFLDLTERPDLRFGIIVTADCDLVLEKHRGTVSYVPILPLSDYLAIYVLPRKLVSSCRPVVEQLCGVVSKAISDHRSEFTRELDERAILSWFQRDPVERILAELRITDERKSAVVRELSAAYLDGEKARTSASFCDQVNVLLRLRALRGGGSKNPTSALEGELRSDIKNLPGDAFFLGALGPHYREGYVACLRFVREVTTRAIAIRQPDLRDPETVGRRIARLQSPFLYGLTQQLGSVFSSIGLPQAYEVRRDTLPLPLGLIAGQPRREPREGTLS